jgi:hypothetical protein
MQGIFHKFTALFIVYSGAEYHIVDQGRRCGPIHEAISFERGQCLVKEDFAVQKYVAD